MEVFIVDKIKKYFGVFLVMAVVTWNFLGTLPVQAAGSKITLNYKSATMRVGDTLDLNVILNNGVKMRAGITWKSSNKKVASVNKKGNVKAKKTGTATITAMAKNKKGKATCKIKVQKKQADKGKDSVMNIQVGKKDFKAKLADNSSAKALAKKLAKSPITISMQDYGGFEKVGDFGFNLVTNDKQITTEPEDLVLYEGDQLVQY